VTLSGKTLEPDEALQVIAKVFGFAPSGGASLLLARVAAEYLRHFLCDLSRPEASAPAEPVHASRIVNRLRQQLSPFLPQEETGSIEDVFFEDAEEQDDGSPERQETDLPRQILDHLQLIREVAHLGKGYCLPAPQRLVRLPETGNPAGPAIALAISGLPTREAERHFQTSLEAVALIRVATLDALPAEIREEPRCWQPWHQWLGRPASPLAEWLSDLLTEKRGQLAEASPEAGAFEIYLPGRFAGGKWRRWVSDADWDGDPGALHLCRRGGRGTPRRYWLAVLRCSPAGARLEQEATVARSLASRLTYALDAHAGATVPAELTVSDGECALRLWNRLPAEEERGLLALVGPHAGFIGKPPWTFCLGERWLWLITDILKGLGIEPQAPATLGG
jgi:hypothetical protein